MLFEPGNFGIWDSVQVAPALYEPIPGEMGGYGYGGYFDPEDYGPAEVNLDRVIITGSLEPPEPVTFPPVEVGPENYAILGSFVEVMSDSYNLVALREDAQLAPPITPGQCRSACDSDKPSNDDTCEIYADLAFDALLMGVVVGSVAIWVRRPSGRGKMLAIGAFTAGAANASTAASFVNQRCKGSFASERAACRSKCGPG